MATREAPAALLDVAARVDARLRDVLDGEVERWSQLSPGMSAPYEALRQLVLDGGKRLRPAFAYWGFAAGGGDPDDPLIIDAGAAFEFLQAFALFHDDVMDDSATRRGQRAAHRVFADNHTGAAWRGEARRFGEGVAVLIGDLAHVYADQLFPGRTGAAADLWNELRLELNVGQYLDLIGTAEAVTDLDAARLIARYKSGKYTIERPLHVGAALAGRFDELEGVLSAYGDPLGEAFQLRDDLLGAFGDEALTGKPVGDDLREGKPTPLLAYAHQEATPAQLDVLGIVGRPDLDADAIAQIQDVLVNTSAVKQVEALIEELTSAAIDAVESSELPALVRTNLVDLANFVAWRAG